jgi:hypothetical protein
MRNQKWIDIETGSSSERGSEGTGIRSLLWSIRQNLPSSPPNPVRSCQARHASMQYDLPAANGFAAGERIRLLAVGNVVKSDVPDESLIDAHPRHGFKVPGNSLPGDVVADPVPLDPGFYRIGRMHDPPRQFFGGHAIFFRIVLDTAAHQRNDATQMNRSVVLERNMRDPGEFMAQVWLPTAYFTRVQVSVLPKSGIIT